MTEKFKIEVTTPGKLVYSGNIEMATIPGEDGEFGVLAGHSALISNLQPAGGVVKIYSNANDNDSIETRIFVAGGFVEVNPDEASILATEAYDLSQVNKEDIQNKITSAQAKFNTSNSDFDKRRAQEAIELNQQILGYLG